MRFDHVCSGFVCLLAFACVTPQPAPKNEQPPEEQLPNEQAPNEDPAQEMPPANTPSVPGGAGAIVVSQVTTHSLQVSWTAATDAQTPAAELQYRVFFASAHAGEPALTTAEEVQNNGTPANDWTANLTSLTLEGLSLHEAYRINVLVRDAASAVSVYQPASATTLDGTWLASEPLENYTTGSVYYSKVQTAPNGTLVVAWNQDMTWDSTFTVHDASVSSSWSTPAAWSQSNFAITSWKLLGESVDGVSWRYDDPGYTLRFSRYSLPTGTFSDEDIATPSENFRTSLATFCTSNTGDVMVVWIDGASSSLYGVNARFYDAATDVWSATELVSPTNTLELQLLKVACHPAGDHLVVYSDATTVYVRRRVAAMNAWQEAAQPISPGNFDSSMSNLQTGTTATGDLVVAWVEREELETVPSISLMTKTFSGGAWSADVTRVRSVPATGNFSMVSLLTKNRPHLIWTHDGSAYSSAQDPMGVWSSPQTLFTEASFETIAGDNRRGDVLFAWRTQTDISARRYHGGVWETPTPIKTGGHEIGYGSMNLGLSDNGSGVISWTEYVDMTSFSLFARRFQ